jgi:hypothetical protein
MDQRTATARVPDPDAVEFIRFCYRRRRVGWPELYDEMCAVAARGLFRGLGSDDLAVHGIGFSLFDTPALAAAASWIVAEEQALRRPVTVVIAPAPEANVPVVEREPVAAAVATVVAPARQPAVESSPTSEAPVRFVVVPAGA